MGRKSIVALKKLVRVTASLRKKNQKIERFKSGPLATANARVARYRAAFRDCARAVFTVRARLNTLAKQKKKMELEAEVLETEIRSYPTISVKSVDHIDFLESMGGFEGVSLSLSRCSAVDREDVRQHAIERGFAVLDPTNGPNVEP